MIALQAADELVGATHPGTAGHRVAADGGLAGSVRAVADSRAGAIRPVGRADRPAAARRRRPVLQHRGHHPLRPRCRARREGSTAAGAGRARRVRRGLCPRPRHPLPVQQHRARHPGDRTARCSTAKSPTAKGDSTTPSPTCGAQSNSTITPVRRTVGLDAADPSRLRRAAARAGPRRGSRRRYMPPTSGWTPRWPGHASILATYGACTATTNACNGWAAPPRRRSSANSWS